MKVKLENKTIEVTKLPIGKYAELLKALKRLPSKLQMLEGLDQDAMLDKLPALIGESLPEFVSILSIATPLESEEIERLGLSEVIDLIMAVALVNDYKGVYEKIKKATAQTGSPK